MGKIYVFAIPATSGPYVSDVMGYALSEDGELLASHYSSCGGWSPHDMGIQSNWKHDLYEMKYPDGYDLEWIDYDNLQSHPGYLEAYRLNQLKKKEDKNG